MTRLSGRSHEQTLTRFVETAENASAVAAVRRVADCVCSSRARREVNPLVLHGPPGTGKSHLAQALVAEVLRRKPDRIVSILPAADWGLIARGVIEGGTDETDLLASAREADLLVVEDVHALSSQAADLLAWVIDDALVRDHQLVFTAMMPPRLATQLPARLSSRLAGGLVVELNPLSAAGRLVLLETLAQRRQVAVPRDVLGWLAQHLTGGGRQIVGAIARLEALVRSRESWLDVAAVEAAFREDVEAGRPTIERIVERVSGAFRVETRLLKSARRSRSIVWPRQIGMYLARQVTKLSLAEIGGFFGNRDHTTVLHACQKVESALSRDEKVRGLVRQLRAELI